MLLAGCSWTDTRPTRTSDGSGIGPYDDSGIPDVIPKVEVQTGAGNPEKYKVFGKRYRVMTNAEARGYRKRGKASWYGEKFHGRKTSNGEIYNMYDVTAAHKTLRIPSYVQVTHLKNGRSIIVRVNDRGPFVGDRIIDLSYGAATKLGMVEEGVADVEISLIDPTTYVAPAPAVQVASTTIDFAKIPNATTFPIDSVAAQNMAASSSATDVIGDISALPQSQTVQPAIHTQRDASAYIQSATPSPANDLGNVQYRVAASGELVTEDFTEIYIAENQIAEYERLNPEEALTAPAAIKGEVTEVAFGDAPAVVTPMVVEPESTGYATEPAPAMDEPQIAATNIVRAADGGLPFYVQVATFQNADNAINMAEKLVSQQFKPVRLVPGDFGGKQLQQVRVGPYLNAQQANTQQVALVQAGYPRCFVIRSKH